MAQPFDYTLSGPTPSQNLLSTIQLGSGLRQLNLEEQKAQQAAAMQQQLQTDITEVADNLTPTMIAKLSLKYPQLSEGFKRSYDMLTESEQNAKVQTASEVYAALQSGNADLAQSMLEERATAYENSGDKQEAKVLRDMAKLAVTSPETAQIMAGTFLSSAMGPEKFGDTFTRLYEERVRAGEKGRYSYNKGFILDSVTGELKAPKLGEGINPEDKLTNKDILSLNKDVTALTKEADKIRQSAIDLRKLKTSGTPASQLAGVIKFMKVLDPTSVVKQEEGQMVVSAQGPAATLAGMVNNLMGEGKLTEKAFEDIAATAETLANSAITSTQSSMGEFFNTFNLDPKLREKMEKRVPQLLELESTPTTTTEPLPKEPKRSTVEITPDRRSLVEKYRTK